MVMTPTVSDVEVAEFWDGLDFEPKVRIAREAVRWFSVRKFAPLYTNWKYVLRPSREKLLPVIVREISTRKGVSIE